MISESTILGNMAECTREYKKLELMFKESDQKMEKDLSRMEGKLDSTLVNIRTLINAITIQPKEIKKSDDHERAFEHVPWLAKSGFFIQESSSSS